MNGLARLRLNPGSRPSELPLAASAGQVAARMSEGIRALGRSSTARRRTAWLLVPVVAASLATALLTGGSPATASRGLAAGGPLSELAANTSATLAPARSSFRPLPSGRSATFGRVPFAASPPRHRKRGEKSRPAPRTGCRQSRSPPTSTPRLCCH